MTATSDTKGFYTKIGRIVHCSGQLITSSLNGATANGSIQMGGFPFINQDEQGAQSGGIVAAASGLNITAGTTLTIQLLINQQNASFKMHDAADGSTDMLASEWSDNGNITFSITYMTNT